MDSIAAAFSKPALSARGIYWADYTLEGNAVMYGVSSAGEVVAFLSVRHGTEDAAALHIQQRLDAIDPRPPSGASAPSHLRLVPGE